LQDKGAPPKWWRSEKQRPAVLGVRQLISWWQKNEIGGSLHCNVYELLGETALLCDFLMPPKPPPIKKENLNG